MLTISFRNFFKKCVLKCYVKEIILIIKYLFYKKMHKDDTNNTKHLKLSKKKCKKILRRYQSIKI